MSHVNRILLCTILVHIGCASEDSEAVTATESSEASETMQPESNGATTDDGESETEGAESETEGDTEAEGDTETEGGTETEGDTEDGGFGPSSCECITLEQDIYADTTTCDAPMPCGALQLRCPSEYPCPDEELTVDDPDALQCALQTLGGSEPAYISWEETDSEDFGIFERDGFIYVDGQGNAEFYVLDYEDLSATFSDVQRGSLIEAAQLEACTSAEDVRSRFECLAAPLATVESVCQEGGWVDISE